MLKFSNPTHFRQIIVCSLLSERPVLIESINYLWSIVITIFIQDIRLNEDNFGLTEYEVNFLKLVELITNGTKLQIDETGSSVKFYPGIITNNDDVNFEFDCGNMRCLTYYLESLVIIALFGKSNLQCVLKGITNDELDQSVYWFSDLVLLIKGWCIRK